MIFTSFSKGSQIFTVRKYKPVDKSGEDNEHKKEVKVQLEDFDKSEVDKIIKGQREGVKVYYEDEQIIAFDVTSKPVAKVHILIVAKEAQLTSLRKVQEGKDEALLGHMMVQAASIAREAGLQDGYRIVTENGRDC